MIYPALGLIGDIGGPELLLIFVLVLLLFGGQRLPDFARGLGKSIREFKKATSGVEEEIKRAMEEPPAPIKRSAMLPPPAPPPLETFSDVPSDTHSEFPESGTNSDPSDPSDPGTDSSDPGDGSESPPQPKPTGPAKPDPASGD